MGEWKKTGCTLWSATCGLEMQVETNRIVRVRPDQDNPRSNGYCCRKGRNIQFFQHQKDRILYPLKRVGDKFERISWEQATNEICERLRKIVDEHGPRSFACQGLGGFIGQMHTLMAKQFIAAVGTQYHYRALAAELTGFYWSCGVVTGNQTYIMHPDEENCEVFIASGWNPYVTHNMLQGKRVVHEFSVESDKVMITIDPRRSETARMSDVHLAIRPGTDALLWRAMIALVLQEGWQNQAYIDEHVSDLEQVLPWFEGIDVKEYCEFCELDYEDVYKVTRLIATKKTGLHSDLGVICGRHSSVTTHLQHILLAITGNLLTPGGNCYNNFLVPGTNSKYKDPSVWRTLYSDYPQLFGLYPTAALGDDIDNPTENRIRALISFHSNPLRSVVNTKRLERAFDRLDLLVTVDAAFTETARVSDYVLPDATGYECYEINTMSKSFPLQYHQLRQPIIKPEGEILEGVEVWVRMLDSWGAIPKLPDSLYDAAKGDRREYLKALNAFLDENPDLKRFRITIVAKTLGVAMGSMAKAVYWSLLNTSNERFREDCANMGYERGPDQIENIFETVCAHPEGVMVGKIKPEAQFDRLETPDKKLHLFAEELDEWIYEINPKDEAAAMHDPEYPMVMNAGRHVETNINQTMRDPAWIKGKPDPDVMTIHPVDAERLQIADGQLVTVTTPVGQGQIRARLHRETRPGSVLIPHGHGFIYNNKLTGLNINLLTDCKNRDRFAGTPFMRYQPCRVEPVSEGGEQ